MPTDSTNPARGKTVFFCSLIIFLYFAFLITAHELQYDPVIIGVFREMLTLPFIGVGLVLLVAAARQCIKAGFRPLSYPFYSLGLLLLTVTLMIVFA